MDGINVWGESWGERTGRACQAVTVLEGAPAPSQEGMEGGEGTCTSLSMTVTKASISEPRIALTVTTHSLVAEGSQQ